MVIDQRDMAVFADAHLVEGISQLMVHTQAVRIGCHECPNLQAVYIDPARRHFGEDVAFGEHPHQAAQVDDQHTVCPFALHDLNSLTHSRAALAGDRRLQRRQRPNGPLQHSLLVEGSLLRNLLFFLEDLFTHMVSFQPFPRFIHHPGASPAAPDTRAEVPGAVRRLHFVKQVRHHELESLLVSVGVEVPGSRRQGAQQRIAVLRRKAKPLISCPSRTASVGTDTTVWLSNRPK